jgi:2-polyprenyl-3-methyl-5-hydroxy-6-metoxy-1,4-benzoquinol methylase
MRELAPAFADRYHADAVAGFWVPRDGTPSFSYSDGAEVERRLLEIVRGVDDRSVLSEQLRAAITDWPSRYHLSPRRANLLRPLENLLHGRAVLEIGAGCGAITRFLGESGAHVTAIEGSAARARVAAARCADLDNVSVIVDAFDRLPVAPLFDVVCLIGVLEYARLFFPADGGDAVAAMLVHAVGFLRPGGHLVLAIENQLGLKYFAGYREDHVSRAMFGIEDLYARDGVVTFGKSELSDLLRHVGLPEQEWLYPFPDYKLPVTVMTGRALSEAGIDVSSMLSASVVADPQVPDYFRFSLEQAWQPVFRNRLAGELSNSFLVVASSAGKTVVPHNALVYHYAVERRPVFSKVVCITLENGEAMVRSHRLRRATEGSDEPVTLRLEDAVFFSGRHWQLGLYECLNRPGWSVPELAAWVEVWLAALLELEGMPEGRRDKNLLMSRELLDAVPRNLILHDSKAHFFDLEWVAATRLPLGYLLFRGVVLSLLAVASVAPPGQGTPLRVYELLHAVAEQLGVPLTHDDVRAYFTEECNFQEAVNGTTWIPFAALNAYELPTRPVLGQPAAQKEQSKDAVSHPSGLRRRLSELARKFSGHQARI